MAYLVRTDIAVGLLAASLVVGSLTQRRVIGLLSLPPGALVLHLRVVADALPSHAFVDVACLLHDLLLTSLGDCHCFVAGTLHFLDPQSPVDSLRVLNIRSLVRLHLVLLCSPLVRPLLTVVLERDRHIFGSGGNHLVRSSLNLDLVLCSLPLVGQNSLRGHRLQRIQVEARR